MDRYDKIIKKLDCKDGVLDIIIKSNTKIGKKLIEDFYYNNWNDSSMANDLYERGGYTIASICCFGDEAKRYMQQVDNAFKGRRVKKEISNLAKEIFLEW